MCGPLWGSNVQRSTDTLFTECEKIADTFIGEIDKPDDFREYLVIRMATEMAISGRKLVDQELDDYDSPRWEE